MKSRPNYNKLIKISLNSFDKLFQLSTKEILLWFLVISTRWWRQNSSVAACARALFSMSECLAEKRRVSPYNAIWWCRQQTLRKLMKNMTRKSWIFWNWQSLPELSDLEKSDLKIRSRSVKKRSTIRSRSWSRKMVKSDLRSDQKVICRSRSWSVDQDRHYFVQIQSILMQWWILQTKSTPKFWII